MNVQFNQKMLSSFLLYLDHNLLDKGNSFANYSGFLYPVESKISGRFAYATPFKQLVNDTSLSGGAHVMSGVYLNGNFVTVGQSGLLSINHNQGAAYFSSQLPANTIVSGNYSIKEINVELTDDFEYKLLFETKFVTNSKFNQVLSGLPLDTKLTPSVFLKMKKSRNEPFGFGGIDNDEVRVRAIIIVDNEFQRIGVCNILQNLNYRPFQIVESTPFDYLGNFTGVNYNYNGLNFNNGYYPLVLDVDVKDIQYTSEFANIGRSVAIVDFKLSSIMRHP